MLEETSKIKSLHIDMIKDKHKFFITENKFDNLEKIHLDFHSIFFFLEFKDVPLIYISITIMRSKVFCISKRFCI